MMIYVLFSLQKVEHSQYTVTYSANCLKCMGIQNLKNDFISNCNNIKMVYNQCLKMSCALICQEKVRENKYYDEISEMDDILKRFQDVG